jgi:hypothetical protein
MPDHDLIKASCNHPFHLIDRSVLSGPMIRYVTKDIDNVVTSACPIEYAVITYSYQQRQPTVVTVQNTQKNKALFITYFADSVMNDEHTEVNIKFYLAGQDGINYIANQTYTTFDFGFFGTDPATNTAFLLKVVKVPGVNMQAGYLTKSVLC